MRKTQNFTFYNQAEHRIAIEKKVKKRNLCLQSLWSSFTGYEVYVLRASQSDPCNYEQPQHMFCWVYQIAGELSEQNSLRSLNFQTLESYRIQSGSSTMLNKPEAQPGFYKSVR